MKMKIKLSLIPVTCLMLFGAQSQAQGVNV